MNKLFLTIPAVLILIIAFYPVESDEVLCLETCRKKLLLRQQAEKEIIPEPLDDIYNDTEKFLEEVKQNPDNFKNIKPIFISLFLSDSCKITANCPTLKGLADAYDNSDRELSGDFENSTGEWKRERPIIPKAFELYRYGPTKLILFVEPDAYTMERTKQIIIEPKLDEYLLRSGGGLKMENIKLDNYTVVNQRLTYSNYYIDSCSKATMGWATTGYEILSEIVKHFYTNCKSIIPLNNTNVIQQQVSNFYYCGQECQYQAWLKNATERVKQGGYLIGKE